MMDHVEHSKAEIKGLRRISPIWAVPIVALLVAGWLGWTTLEQKGPLISISFRTAAGIEPGKTHVKHHDIDLGVVERVVPSPDLMHVVVSARMNKMAAEHLRSGTSFWVVRPRISLSGLSGLDTLVSGAYIEMDPGEGERASAFKGLEEPPVVRADVPGTEFVLTTDRLGSLGAGSPIYHRGIKVGEVMADSFDPAKGEITLRVFVRAPYDALVRDRTLFWNASSVRLSSSGSGFKVELESLQAVLSGAIAFETPDEFATAEASKEGTGFRLFADHDQARSSLFVRSLTALVEFGGSVRGLEVGSAVEFRGIKIGQVVEFHPVFDVRTKSFSVPVTIALDVDRIGVRGGTREEVGSGVLFPEFVARGLRAQLRSTSLLTGQLAVALDFFPDAAPATIDFSGPIPKLPTLPNEIENITRSVNETLDKISALPLDAVVADVRRVLASVLAISEAPEIRDTMRSANGAMTQAERLLRDANGQVAPLAGSLRKASEAAEQALKQADTMLVSLTAGYGRDSAVRQNLAELLRQFQDTAQSVRRLADYLEQHPEALVRGKGAPQ